MFKGWMLALSGLLCGWSMQLLAAVDINSATAEQLAEALKGVGAVKAQEIVRYREQHGPFQSIDQLVVVKGIGAKLVDNNRDRMSAESPEAKEQ